MLGVVVGLAAEARLAQRLGCPLAVGGGGAAGAAEAVRRLVAQGATALLSFGLAGGLAPGLAAGAIVIPEMVMDVAGRRWLTDPTLAARLGGASGIMLASTTIIATAAAKSAAWRQTGACATDLETGMVAAAGLPFGVLRAVCDPAERNLPPAAQTALDTAGRIRPGALLRSLARHPGQITELIALGREAALARRALLAHLKKVGPINPN